MRSIAQLEAINRRYSWVRLWVFLAGAAVTLLALLSGILPLFWIALGIAVAAFSVAVAFHRKVDRSLIRFRIARRLVQTQLARQNLDWGAIPPPHGEPARPDHPFGFDLNITGEHSLLQLLDTAVSRGGGLRLRDWLLNTRPDLEQIQQRQAALREMIPLHGFRFHLHLKSALVSPDDGEPWDGEKLLAWLHEQKQIPGIPPVLLVLSILAAANIVLFLLSAAALLPSFWLATLTIYALVYFLKYRELGDLFVTAYDLSQTLEQFRAVLVYLENYPFQASGPLARLCEPFWKATCCPSRILRSLGRIASAASLKGNQVVWLVLNTLLPWDLYFALRLQQARRQVEALLPTWLETWYELEALNSLSNFAFLNPDYAFPQVVFPLPGQPVFSARQIGHPLIPDETRISNDFALQTLGELALVTGSNMSGKSTFLRTLGVNQCLAFAGSPVCATELQTLPFRLFTCINVSDSLNDGISYFYAEVRRLKVLLDELNADQPPPLFFLIDEIFRGTNNRERQIGSRSYVEALVGGHGVGAISTHDLELIHLAEQMPGIKNYHFREEVRDGLMIFDYRLRPGPSPTTNALKIMKLEGLPVEDGETIP